MADALTRCPHCGASMLNGHHPVPMCKGWLGRDRDALRPCPFCGSSVESFKKHPWTDPIIWCRECDLYIESMKTIGPKGLADAWNRRTV